MRLVHVVAALLMLPVVATPVHGDFHEQADGLLADREFILVMRGSTFNGATHPDTPLLEAYLGERLRFTVAVPPGAEPHTFHLHGHPWLVGAHGRIVDTFLVKPGETHTFDVRAGGVDRHAGDWMYHCHVASHQAHGMWGVLRVYPYRVGLDLPGPLMTIKLDRLGVPLDGATLALEVDGQPLRAHVAPLTDGRYLVHAPEMPYVGELVVKATHPELGDSLARLPLGGAPARAPTLADLGATAHGHAPPADGY